MFALFYLFGFPATESERILLYLHRGDFEHFYGKTHLAFPCDTACIENQIFEIVYIGWRQ